MKRLIFLTIIIPLPLFAWVSPNVNVSDGGIYRAIDRLKAVGAVDDVILGQRPFSRQEVMRILAEAEGNIDRLKNPADKIMVYKIIKYWKEKYGDVHSGWEIRFLERLDVSYEYLSGPDRPICDNGMGTVRAHVRPLTELRDGRRYANGSNFAFESYHSLTGRYAAVFAHPRFQLQIPSSDVDGENDVFVQELYGKLGTGNFEFEVGRDYVVWGQGEFGGLMFSNNARGLDLVKFSNPHPLKIPAVGDFKGTLFVANMGPHYNYKYAYLTAVKGSLMPADFAEVGVYYGFIAGGNGAPSLWKADGMGGVDFRFRIPPVSDAEVYGEVYFDEIDTSHLKETFADKTAYIGGLYLPRLGNSNNMALRFEYKYLGAAVYRNRVWRDGLALGRELIGDPLGPSAQGAYISYYYDLGMSSQFIARFAYERRGAPPAPAEKRYRGRVDLKHPIKGILRADWFVGYEAIQDFNFAPGNRRDGTFAGLELSFDLDI